MPDNLDNSDKDAFEEVTIKLPKEIYRLVRGLAFMPNDDFTGVYGEEEDISFQNLFIHMIIQHGIENFGIEHLEGKGINLLDHNLEIMGGRLRMCKQFEYLPVNLTQLFEPK